MQLEMKYIYQVYLDGSFSKAAEHLYITQPALSISVQKVENSLGMPIFDRNTRPLTLTPAGQIYIETVRRAMDLEQELEQQIADIRDLNSGSLRLGGSHYLNAYILPEILTGFTRQYPGIRLELLEGSSAWLSQRLSNKELDLTFNCNPNFLQNFDHFPAFRDHILLAVPESISLSPGLEAAALSAEAVWQGRYLEADCPAVDLAQFQDLEFLLLSPGNNLYDRGLQLFQEAGFIPRIKLQVGQLVTAHHLADAAMAATFVCDRIVPPQGGRLRYFKLASQLTERQFHFVLPARKYVSFATRAFIRYFTEHMETL